MAEKRESAGYEVRDISIALDSYDDIFSDFDPRPYGERELSSDFLREIDRRYMEAKSGKIEVRFLLPKEARNAEIEEKIKRRLKSHFAVQLREVQEALSRARKEALGFILAGTAITFLAGLLYDSFLPTGLVEVILVAGWFAVWSGLDRFFFGAREYSKQLEKLEKFRKADYIFLNEGD